MDYTPTTRERELMAEIEALKAQLAREQESVNELSIALQVAEKRIKELEASTHPHVDCFYFGGSGCNNIRLGVKPKGMERKIIRGGSDGR